jgi:hypothetical protein
MTDKPHMTMPNGDKLYEGDYGRTRDGQKVGPLCLGRDCGSTYRWAENPHKKGRWDDDGEDGFGFAGQNSCYDIIARWTDAPAEPVLWRDMTPEQKGALLLAHHEGKVIQCWDTHGSVWANTTEPRWAGAYAYRIRPEPVVHRVPLAYMDGASFRQIGTVALIDGKPDPASIRIEAIE